MVLGREIIMRAKRIERSHIVATSTEEFIVNGKIKTRKQFIVVKRPGGPQKGIEKAGPLERIQFAMEHGYRKWEDLYNYFDSWVDGGVEAHPQLEKAINKYGL